MNKIKFIMITLIIFVTFGCRSKDSKQNIIGNFDISINDEQILFSYYSRGGSSIYSMDMDGSDKKRICLSANVPKYLSLQKHMK